MMVELNLRRELKKYDPKSITEDLVNLRNQVEIHSINTYRCRLETRIKGLTNIKRNNVTFGYNRKLKKSSI